MPEEMAAVSLFEEELRGALLDATGAFFLDSCHTRTYSPRKLI